MTIEDINVFIDVARSGDEEGIKRLSERLGIAFEDFDEFARKFIVKVESDNNLLEYFKNIMKADGEIAGFAAGVFSRPETAREFFGNREEYGFDAMSLRCLVITTKDMEIIREVVDNTEKYGLTNYDVFEIILNCGNVEYVKECVTRGTELGFNDYQLIEIIKSTGDIEYIKECVARRTELEINDYQLVEIIKGLGDTDYIKECIDKGLELGFSSFVMAEIIKNTGDIDYIRQCIDKGLELGLTSLDMANIIKSTGNMDYIRECVARGVQLGIRSSDLIDVIKSTGDIEYIKECVDKNSLLGLSSLDVTEIIKSLGDMNYIRQCVDRGIELGLNVANMVNIIKSTGDIDYIKECVQRGEQLGLGGPGVAGLIKSVGDIAYVKECIGKRKEIGLDSTGLAVLIKNTSDTEYVEKLLEAYGTKKKVQLPPNMTIGVEIECEGELSSTIMNQQELFGWQCKPDASLSYGVEVISPVLYSQDQPENNINKVCAKLSFLGQGVSERCGGHVHIGADYLTSVEAYKVFGELWGNSERILYSICNECGDMPRSGVVQYAAPLSKKIEDAISSGEIDLAAEEDMEDFAQSMKKIQGNNKGARYSGVNFMNVGKHGKNTIEFRLSNGTINPETWIENINLFGGIVAASQEISVLLDKPENELSESEIIKVEAYRAVIDGKSDERAKLDALLELTVPEDKQVYVDRYEEMSKHGDVMESIYSATATKSITLKKKDIKDVCLDGPEAVGGVEYGEMETLIDEQLMQIGSQARTEDAIE